MTARRLPGTLALVSVPTMVWDAHIVGLSNAVARAQPGMMFLVVANARNDTMVVGPGGVVGWIDALYLTVVQEAPR